MSTDAPVGPSPAVFTLPNLISFSRILLIPAFVSLIVHRGTEVAGLALFGVVAASDWIDGYVARRTGQVTELGKLLDPTADRLALAAGLIAMVIRGVFPLWASLLILVRDGLILLAGGILLVWRGGRIEVRFVGKVATFGLMTAIPLIAWSRLDLAFAAATATCGWAIFGVAIVEYYVATGLYVGDLASAFHGAPGDNVPDPE